MVILVLDKILIPLPSRIILLQFIFAAIRLTKKNQHLVFIIRAYLWSLFFWLTFPNKICRIPGRRSRTEGSMSLVTIFQLLRQSSSESQLLKYRIFSGGYCRNLCVWLEGYISGGKWRRLVYSSLLKYFLNPSASEPQKEVNSRKNSKWRHKKQTFKLI